MRKGISLLEVLISMFVLLIGLLGVAALIPAGRHEILAGVKMDYASMVGRGAFRDLKIRGFLAPENWQDVSGTVIYTPPRQVSDGGIPPTLTTLPDFNCANSNSLNKWSPPARLTPAVVFDPLGLSAGFGVAFPYGAAALSLTRIYPSAAVNSAPLADPVFRCADDLVLIPNANSDFPPEQRWFRDSSGVAVKRASVGNYSWLATVTTEPSLSAMDSKIVVSVAVFYKRDLSPISAGGPGPSGETTADAAYNNGEITLTNFSAAKPVKPGQWIMLAGSLTSGLNTWSYFRWYRIVSADSQDAGQQFATISGPDWNPGITNTQAWIFDGVIAVYEKNYGLEW